MKIIKTKSEKLIEELEFIVCIIGPIMRMVSLFHLPATLALLRVISGLPHYSFDGMLMNITKVINREGSRWFVVAWNTEKKQLFKYPFREDDTNVHTPYCLFEHGMASDKEADSYPTGPRLDYFGAPEGYSRRPIRALRDRTVALGIIVRNQKVHYSMQNMCILDAFNSTLVTWRLRDQRRLDKTQYVFVDREDLDEHGNFKKITPIDWVEYRDSDRDHFPHIGEDMRLIKLQSDPSRIFANWCLNREENGIKFVTFHFGEMHYPGIHLDGSGVVDGVKKVTESLYVEFPGHKINMYHEMTPRSEKNWPMFEYVNESWASSHSPSEGRGEGEGEGEDGGGQRRRQLRGNSRAYEVPKKEEFWHYHRDVGRGLTGGGNLLFVHSIQPLRVVGPGILPQHVAKYNLTGDTSAQSVSMSLITNFCWNFGRLRGGTSPQLVTLPVGYRSYGGIYNPTHPNSGGGYVGDGKVQEYLAFFHSNVNMAQHKVMTYMLGAYTFTRDPPFRITAMSKYPIVSPDWMDSFTYKHTDIVVFPMTFEHDEKFVNVSYGWDEGEGYILTLDKKILFDSLRPTTTTVLGSVDVDLWREQRRPRYDSYEYRYVLH